MILETTQSNKNNKNLINDLVGRPFKFFERIKMNGIGSKRMVIQAVSPNLNKYLNTVGDVNYANIELRPGGILIRINKGLQNFTWAIPYYQLVIYKTNGSSIHAQGRFINFKNNILLKENKEFLKKMMDLKIKYDFDFQSPTMSMY
jgi:hypothetical protein